MTVPDDRGSRRREAEQAEDLDERVNVVLQQALDEALRSHVVNLFLVWMKDPTGQPQRAANGVSKAVAAYRDAVTAINSKALEK